MNVRRERNGRRRRRWALVRRLRRFPSPCRRRPPPQTSAPSAEARRTLADHGEGSGMRRRGIDLGMGKVMRPVRPRRRTWRRSATTDGRCRAAVRRSLATAMRIAIPTRVGRDKGNGWGLRVGEGRRHRLCPLYRRRGPRHGGGGKKKVRLSPPLPPLARRRPPPPPLVPVRTAIENEKHVFPSAPPRAPRAALDTVDHTVTALFLLLLPPPPLPPPPRPRRRLSLTAPLHLLCTGSIAIDFRLTFGEATRTTHEKGEECMGWGHRFRFLAVPPPRRWAIDCRCAARRLTVLVRMGATVGCSGGGKPRSSFLAWGRSRIRRRRGKQRAGRWVGRVHKETTPGEDEGETPVSLLSSFLFLLRQVERKKRGAISFRYPTARRTRGMMCEGGRGMQKEGSTQGDARTMTMVPARMAQRLHGRRGGKTAIRLWIDGRKRKGTTTTIMPQWILSAPTRIMTPPPRSIRCRVTTAKNTACIIPVHTITTTIVRHTPIRRCLVGFEEESEP